MKWLIASDIHGSAYYCRKLIDAYKNEKAERILLLGDILYHGPRNDLPKEYDPKAVIEMLNGFKSDIICVRGNCDTEVDQMVLDFPIMAEYALLTVGKHLIFATHGHKFNKDDLPKIKSGDILLHGHTHISTHTYYGEILYCNPGSVSIPKEGTEHGYMTLEGDVFTWKDIDGNILDTLKIE